MSGQWVALWVLLALVGVALAMAIAHDYQTTQERERERLLTQARIVDENLGLHLQGIHAALTNIRDDAATLVNAGQSAVVAQRLKAMTDAMPGVRTMLVLDATGKVVASSRPELTGLDLGQRAYFQRARVQPDRDRLYVTEPFTTTLQVFSINLMKVWLGPRGELGGVVTATLDPQFFEVLLRSVLYAEGTRSTLVHGMGRVFVGMQTVPTLAVPGGADGTAFLTRHLASGQVESFFVGAPGADGEPRAVAFRTAQVPQVRPDEALVASISRPVSTVLVAWRRSAIFYAAAYVAVLVTAWGAFTILQARQHDLDGLRRAQEQETREQVERLRSALAGGDIGFWEVNLATGQRTVDSRAQEMVGLRAEVPGGTIEAWRLRVHPQDKDAWIAAWDAHVAGESEAFVADYRVRHEAGHWIWIHTRGKVSSRDADGKPLRLVGTYLDISERKASEARVVRSEQLLARMSRVSRTGGWDYDLASGKSTWSDEMFRIRELDPLVSPDQDLVMTAFVPESRAALQAAREAAIRQQTPWDMELQMFTARGHLVWVRSQGEAVVENGVTVALTGTLKNITWRKQSQIDLKAANEKLERMAMSDGLTGIANRRLFDQTLPVEWLRSARAHAPLSLLMVDIDHFKAYNDHYGHAGGDACLRQVAAALSSCSRRAGDLVSRFGGEEFAVLLPAADLESATSVASACVQAVIAARIVHEASPTGSWVSVSVGVATLVPSADMPYLSLIERADAALYRAKQAGRGRFAVFDAPLEAPAASSV